MSTQFYLQDSRGFVGNDVLFWAKDGKGYTTDVSKAQVYSKEDAIKQHNSRHSDIPWPKEYIDAKTRPAVDMQYIKREEALAGTGIEIMKDKPLKKDVFNCLGCGRFLSESQRWSYNCPHCDADNRP